MSSPHFLQIQKDVAITITEFTDPLQNMAAELPTIRGIQASMVTIPEPPLAVETAEQQINQGHTQFDES